MKLYLEDFSYTTAYTFSALGRAVWDETVHANVKIAQNNKTFSARDHKTGNLCHFNNNGSFLADI